MCRRSSLFLATWCAVLVAADPAELASRAQRAMASAHYEEATALYSELVREMPGVAGVRFNYALALQSGGHYIEAVAQLERVTREAPAMTNAWLILGLAYQKLSQPERAIPAFDRVLKAEPQNKVALLEDGDASLATGRLDEAAGYFRSLTQLEPDAPKALQGLGVAYTSLASDAFARLQALEPDSAYCYALLAQARFDQAQYRQAFELYKKAQAANPAIPDLHQSIAAVYRATNHPDWAEAELRKQTQPQSTNCAPKDAACSLYSKSREYSSLAEKTLSRLVALPESAELHEVAGEVYRMQGRKEDSVREWRAAAELAPADGYAQNGLAHALWLHRDYEEAQPLIERLLKNNAESPQLNLELGAILLEQRNVEKALPLLRKAVKLTPGNAEARAALGRALLTLGQAREAIPNLEAGLAIDEDGSLNYQLGRAWQQLNQAEKAKRYFARQQQLASGTAAAPGGDNQITAP
jgi:tetratricopeptide (TPR) repeat protein